MNPARSIVIPAYAEARFIESTLESLHAYLIALGWLDTTEVIVVTADAGDGTPALAKKALEKFPIHQHLEPGPRVGKGRDVRYGLGAAKSDSVMFMDADLATPLPHIAEIFELLAKEGGMVIGVRELSRMHKTISRKVTSRLSNTIIRTMIGWQIIDSQCGFKAFDRDALDIFLPRAVVRGWGFDFELIQIARQHNISISQLPLPDWRDPKPEGTGLSGDSQLHAMKQALLELWSVKINQFKGVYK